MHTPISATTEIVRSVHEPIRLPAIVPSGIGKQQHDESTAEDQRERHVELVVDEVGDRRAGLELVDRHELLALPRRSEAERDRVPEVVEVQPELAVIESHELVGVLDLVAGQVLRRRVEEGLRLAGDRPEDDEGQRDQRGECEETRDEPAQRERGDARHLDHGSIARRTPSETWLSERTVTRIATVGKIVCQGVNARPL